MARGGSDDHGGFPHPPPLLTSTSIGQEVSGSWMNLSGSFEQHESRFPRRAEQILSVLKLKLAILSGGRDNQGRVIITFPGIPRGSHYDHTHLLQTIQYLSTIPSAEASDLGFILVIDSRIIHWNDVKMILRTSQEALPGQIHIAYIVQPSQFVQKQQISMGLSKEKDKLEFTVIKLSSIDKIARHIDQRQITLDMSGLLNYTHEDWLKLRSITEELIDAYDVYINNSSLLETQLKPSLALSPERLSNLQTEMSRLDTLRTNIETADENVKLLCASLKTELDTNAGTTSLTPEMINCLATVTRISQNTEQQQDSLKELHQQNYKTLEQLFSLKQFELGLAKVNQWIKNKGMEKVLRIDIGDSIPKVLSIQDDLKKLETKAEAVTNDVIELRRIADMMFASEHYAKDSIKERLKKVNSKYSKFKNGLEKRRIIVTSSVAMYKGISEWRQLYDDLTSEWNGATSLKDVDIAKELVVNLESQQSHLKQIAQKVLTQGQEVVKCLKSSSVSQGDPDFRKSLRFISRVTEEVTEKLRKCQEMATVRRAKLDQYVQLLICERDGREGIKTLQGILLNLEASHDGVGTNLETAISISNEVEQHKEETKRSHEYAKKLLHVALEQREQLNDKEFDKDLLTELDNLAAVIYTIIDELNHRLDLSKKLFTSYEPTMAILRQWNKMSSQSSKSANESYAKEIAEKKDTVLSSLASCKDTIYDLQEHLKQPLPSTTPNNNTVSSSSVEQSLGHLTKLLTSIEIHERQLCTDLEHRKVCLDQESRLYGMEQIIEDILIWLREYGLSQFSEFLSLSFTLNGVHDQLNEFCAFRDTCNGITKQVEELEKNVQTELNGGQETGEMVMKTNKRINDLNRVWRRFLIRVVNREKVVTCLYNFLMESMKVASLLSEMLKSLNCHEKHSVLESAYQTTVKQGNSLIVMLKDSPDGTHDSQLADRVTERIEHLSNLHCKIQPLLVTTPKAPNNVTTDNNGTTVVETQADVLIKPGDIQLTDAQLEVAVVQDTFEQESILSDQSSSNIKDVSSESSPVKSDGATFEEIERIATQILQNFSKTVIEFLQLHEVFPWQQDKVEAELKEHEAFLAQKTLEHEELKTHLITLRSFVKKGQSSERRIEYITSRIENSLPNRISLFQRRLSAFNIFCDIIELKDKCTKLKKEIDQLLSSSSDEDPQYKNVQELLTTCMILDKRLEDLSLECTKLTQYFTEISSEVEMRGVEARKVMRQIRQVIEDSLFKFGNSLRRRKKELETCVTKDDIQAKIEELMDWIVTTGTPVMESVNFGTTCEESKKYLNVLKAIDIKRESVAVEMKVLADSIRSLPLTESAILKELAGKLVSVNSDFQTCFSSTHKTLMETERFFISASTLKDELNIAMKQFDNCTQTLNPIVVEKFYTVLCTQAKQASASLQTHRTCNIKLTVDSIDGQLSEIDKLMNKYMLACTSDAVDINAVFSLLDNFLLEIDKDVQDAINSITDTEQETTITKTPIKQCLKSEKITPKFQKPSVTPRKGTVSSLKRLFEPDSQLSDGRLSDPPKSVSKPETNVSVSSYHSRRRLSTSSSINEILSPNNLTSPKSPTMSDQTFGELLATMPDNVVILNTTEEAAPLRMNTTETPMTDQRPIEAPINDNLMAQTPVKIDNTSVQTITHTPIKPSSQVDAVVIVKAKEAPLHSTITVSIQSVRNAPPPIPPLPITDVPPNRPPPPPVSESETDTCSSLLSTPPPIRYHSQDNSQEEDQPLEQPTNLHYDNNGEFSLDYSESPHEPPSSYYTSEESPYEMSSSEHTPRPNSPEQNQARNNKIPTTLIQDNYMAEDPANGNYDDDYLSNISSDVYSNSQNGGYFCDRVQDLKMEECSFRHRDLSPVIEEIDEDGILSHDNPDIGWKKPKDNMDKNVDWSRAHKQSLISMKALIIEFYEDEIRYSNTLSKLLQIYAPILQQTGIFDTVYPIADFQQVFLEQLSQSMKTVPDLCTCFHQNIENLKLYFPFVLDYDKALQIITSINPAELSSLLPSESKSCESDLIVDYTAPYHRIEIYCSLFQQLLRAAFKEDLMNLAALSETLEYLLDLLRILAMELATTKLAGCPFQVLASDVVAMNPFLVHIANKEKEVYLYTVFLHPDALIISERHLDDSKEHTLYSYIMHISLSGLLLVENFHGLADRFAVCEKGQVAAQNFVVFRSCDDISVKDYWVSHIKLLLLNENESITPRETLLPEQVEQIGYMLPTSAPPPPGPSESLEHLSRKRHVKRQKKLTGYNSSRDDSIDGFETPESPSINNIYRVIMDHRTDGRLAHEYLNVKEGDLVEVLEAKGNNFYVSKFTLESSEEVEEEEGYVPACCLQPLAHTNVNSNNNTGSSNTEVVTDWPTSNPTISEPVPLPSNASPTDDLQKDWSVFCIRTGRFDPFPDCRSEQELLNAKMDSLVKYYSDQHEQLGLSGTPKEETENGSDIVARSDNIQESARRLLYKADFLGNSSEEAPSYAQLNGVFSLKHPYAAYENITATNECLISLRKGQLVSVLDSKRDDWWLVSTFPEGDIDKKEGWVKRDMLQHAEYVREDSVVSCYSPSAFTIPPIWQTLAKYTSSIDGAITINVGELVEVIDNCRNKWILVRTLGKHPREGWIPSEYLTPYNCSEDDIIYSPVSSAVHPSFGMEDSISSNEANFDFNVPVSPTFSVGELDSEERRKEALEQRDCTLMELYASEKEYVDRLKYCVVNYKQSIELPNSTAPKSIKAIIDDLFTNISEIHKFHKEEILPRLENCQSNPSGLVDLFSFANSQLKSLYVTYCKGQKKSESILREQIEYFEELRSKLKDRLSLRDYLILPIQRITKYYLLLKNVHEFSIKAGHMILHFQTALGAAQEISRQANNAVHMSMIEGMQRKLSEFGKLVLQDVFEFADQNAKVQFKTRRVFLFERSLIIVKSKQESPDRESYVIKDIFLLNNISLGEDHDDDNKNIVVYEMISGNKFILRATNSRCHEEWLKKANALASLSKKKSLASSVSQGSNLPTGRSRSASEPLDIPPYILQSGNTGTCSPSTLIRQGSQRLRRSARNFNGRSMSATVRKVEKFEPGTIFVVMERIVPQGGEEFELEPGEEVELIKTESNGLLTICTIDEHRFRGSVPPGYLRDKELVKDNMETAPKVTVPLSDLTQYLYDNISISCAFNGFPEPMVEWRRNDSIVTSNDRIKISSCATSSVLEIIDLQYTDEGEYTCILANDLGKDSTEMDLYIEGPPVAPVKPATSRVTPTSVKLRWNPPDHDGHGKVTSYIIEQLREGFGEWQPIVQQPRTVFVVRTLNPNTWYQFRVIACNDNGESRPSEPSEIVSTAKGKTMFMSPATKRKIVLDCDIPNKAVDEIDHGSTSPQTYTSTEDLTTVGVTTTTNDSLVNYHMIRHSSVGSLYDLLPDELGRGRYGILHRCVAKNNGTIYCAKYLKQTELAMNEVKTLHGLCRGKMCDNLVQWIDALSTENNIVIIMEFVQGGELIEFILKSDRLTEGVIVNYLKQLLNALEYIHEKKIIHCDIKPENILVTFEDSPTLKLIDFGSTHSDQSQSSLSITTLAHSLEFCAPEIINKRTVTTFADMWSVGVLTYILLCGTSPFFVESTPVMMQKIIELCYDFNHPDFHQVSPEAKDFVIMMLKRNPTQRLSAPNALQHSWIKTLGEVLGRCSSWPMPTIDLNKLKNFHIRRKLQTSVITTRASSVFKSHSPSPVPVLSDIIHTSLDIIESPPILEEGTEEVQAPVNANVTLEWMYTGYPAPSIVWEYRERKVVPSGRVLITTDNGLTQMSITGVMKSDEGLYTCCALNNIGSDVQECRLLILDKPSAPYSVSCVLLESTSALVSWFKPVSSGNSPITQYILEIRQIEYDQWELVEDDINGMAHVINDLLPGATYVFRVAAVNYIGVSVFSKPSLPLYIHSDERLSCESLCMLSVATMKKSNIDIEYEIQSEIGRGAYSIVYECIERSTDRVYVAKCIPKELNRYAQSEYECLKKLNHPRLVKLEEAFDMLDQTILILEYIPNGELGSYVSPSNRLDENKAARFTRHITEGLQYLHDYSVVHTNLSPKHLLLSTGQTELKIAGFSCARSEEPGNHYQQLPLMPEYHAPESVQLQSMTCSTDMWSVGALILFMLTGYSPFRAISLEKLVSDISTVSISSQCNDHLSSISDDCYDLVFRELLVLNPRKRLTSHQCQRHRWLQNMGPVTASSEVDSYNNTTNTHVLKHMNTEEQVHYLLTKYKNVLQESEQSSAS